MTPVAETLTVPEWPVSDFATVEMTGGLLVSRPENATAEMDHELFPPPEIATE